MSAINDIKKAIYLKLLQDSSDTMIDYFVASVPKIFNASRGPVSHGLTELQKMDSDKTIEAINLFRAGMLKLREASVDVSFNEVFKEFPLNQKGELEASLKYEINRTQTSLQKFNATFCAVRNTSNLDVLEQMKVVI